MKNIHVLPTDKPSRLVKIKDNLFYTTTEDIPSDIPSAIYQYIYITSDEEIKEGDWFYDGDGDLCKYTSDYVVNPNGWNDNKKIILTTDQDLIKDGVQAIDDTFLEWVVKNPSCEEVEVKKWSSLAECGYSYHITISKEEQKQHLIDMMQGDEELGLYEEPKQENTLEEVAERIAMTKDWDFESSEGNGYYDYVEGFTEGAKWMQKRSQSIVPFDAYNIEVFAIKPDEQGKLFAYIGYKISNGNFHFNVVPFTEPQQERMYSEEEVKHIVLEALQPFTVTVDLNQWFEQFKKK